VKILKLGKKGSEDITVKAIFAIFIVIFLLFVVVTLLQSRTQMKIEKAQSEYYTISQNLLTSLISSPCFSSGSYEKDGWQVTTEAFLEEGKLTEVNNANEDITCVQSYDFIYSVEFIDSRSMRSWTAGLKSPPEFAERTITVALPISIRYNSSVPTINPGYAALTAYIGQIPSFYTRIKQACKSHETIQFELDSRYRISYNSSANVFKVGAYFFYPNFLCAVSDFTLSPGRTIAIIRYNESSNSAKILY
jgi:hypothetical protein